MLHGGGANSCSSRSGRVGFLLIGLDGAAFNYFWMRSGSWDAFWLAVKLRREGRLSCKTVHSLELIPLV